MLPMIFNENLFDDLFNDAFAGNMLSVDKALYGKNAARVMKTDVHETDDSYELQIDLPGFKKEELGIELRTVHVHHGLRGAKADRDAGWVQES